MVEANAGGVKDGIADGGGYGHDRSLAGARGRKILAVKQDRFDFRHVAEPRHGIAGETPILDAAVFKFDGFEESAAQPLNHRAYHLVAQTSRVYDGAAFERFDQSHNANGARFLIHGYFRTCRYI